MKTTWRTLWKQRDIVVLRDEIEVDRLPSERIERVFLLYGGVGDSPGDIFRSVVEMADGYALFEAETGFAGRVNFERHAFWRERRCVYWVTASEASLPWRLRLRRVARLGSGEPAYARVGRADLEAQVAGWPLEGPQTWDERKAWRIEKSLPFGKNSASRAHA